MIAPWYFELHYVEIHLHYYYSSHYHTLQHCTILYYTILSYPILYYTILYCRLVYFHPSIGIFPILMAYDLFPIVDYHHVEQIPFGSYYFCTRIPTATWEWRRKTTYLWCFFLGWFVTLVSPTWRFPEMRVPLVLIHFERWDFPWNKPSSDKGVAPFCGNPHIKYILHLFYIHTPIY